MSNKIAVITGASRGIGRAITLKYAQMGYDVAICCHHNKERLEETAKEVRSMQVRCLTYVGNIGNYNDACTFFHEIEAKLGSIDILINNAGISCFGLLQDTTPEQWDAMITSNLNSVFYCSKLAIPEMLSKNQAKFFLFLLSGAMSVLLWKFLILRQKVRSMPLQKLLQKNSDQVIFRSMRLPVV